MKGERVAPRNDQPAKLPAVGVRRQAEALEHGRHPLADPGDPFPGFWVSFKSGLAHWSFL
jgi:hypothetical protein